MIMNNHENCARLMCMTSRMLVMAGTALVATATVMATAQQKAAASAWRSWYVGEALNDAVEGGMSWRQLGVR